MRQTGDLRTLFALVAGMPALCGITAAAAADDYPSKPVRLIVPYPAAGPADTLARLVAAGATAKLGRQFVVDNRGGAGGSIGVETVVKATPDGYTLLFGNDGPVAVNPSLYKTVSYDPVRDLAAITQLTSSQLILVAHPSVPFRSVSELIAAARAQPGRITFASSGSGNASHLAGELLNTMGKIKLVHVPYKGAAPALTDLMGGQVQLLFNNLLSAVPQVKAGKLVALATTGAKRSSATPDVPTVMESGIPGYDLSLWAGILVPAKTPKQIVDQLYTVLVEVASGPDVRPKLVAQGVEFVGSKPREFQRHVAVEVEKWAQVVRASGARVD